MAKTREKRKKRSLGYICVPELGGPAAEVARSVGTTGVREVVPGDKFDR